MKTALLDNRKTLQVYLSQTDKATVEKLALEAGKTTSGYCRDLILERIGSEEKQNDITAN